MAGRPPASEETRELAVTMAKQGHKLADIARAVGRTRDCVCKWLRAYEAEHGLIERRRAGGSFGSRCAVEPPPVVLEERVLTPEEHVALLERRRQLREALAREERCPRCHLILPCDDGCVGTVLDYLGSGNESAGFAGIGGRR